MKQSFLLPLFLFFFISSTFANPPFLPLPNGSTAPNWTLTDENGDTHTLYDYLDQGYTVYIEFFATWCGICWNYKQAGHLENLYNQFGPNGTDQVRVFSIEGDDSTPQSALYGGSGSIGNWVAGINHPVIHAPDNAVPSAYAVVSFPTVYAICPDRKTYNIGTASLPALTDWISSCDLEAETEVSPTSCAGQSDGAIDLTIAGGLNPVSFAWSNGPTTEDVENLSEGDYFCTITEGQGHSIAVGPLTISGPQAIVAFGAPTQASCHGNDGALAVSAAGGTPPYTYDIGEGPSSDPIFTGLPAGTYSVSVTDTNGCENVVEISIPQETPPIADAGPDQVLTCDQSSVLLDGSNSSSGPEFSYLWSTPNGLIPTPDVINPEVAEPGIYILDVLNTLTGCLSSDTALVTADLTVPQIEINPPDTFNCLITQILVTALDLGPCFIYAWTTADGNIIGFNDNEILIGSPGTYTLAVTDTCTGCVASESFQVVAAPALEAEVVDLQDVLCYGENTGIAEVLATGGTEPYFFAWSTGNVEELAGDLPAGTHSVTVTDAAGCENILEVEISEPDSITVGWLGGQVASAPNVPDGVLEFEISGGIPPYELFWYHDGVPLSNFDPNAAYSGEYQVEVMDANACVSFSETFFLPFGSAVKELGGGLNGVKIYPNPAYGTLSVSWSKSLSKKGTFSLLNSVGQECFFVDVEGGATKVSLGLPPLADGIYTLWLKTQEGLFFLDMISIQNP